MFHIMVRRFSIHGIPFCFCAVADADDIHAAAEVAVRAAVTALTDPGDCALDLDQSDTGDHADPVRLHGLHNPTGPMAA